MTSATANALIDIFQAHLGRPSCSCDASELEIQELNESASFKRGFDGKYFGLRSLEPLLRILGIHRDGGKALSKREKNFLGLSTMEKRAVSYCFSLDLYTVTTIVSEHQRAHSLRRSVDAYLAGKLSVSDLLAEAAVLVESCLDEAGARFEAEEKYYRSNPGVVRSSMSSSTMLFDLIRDLQTTLEELRIDIIVDQGPE